MLNILKESFNIIVIPGENKLDQIARPLEKNSHFNPRARFPKISP